MKNGKYIDYDKKISWYKNGQYHRENGPAIELPNGGSSWYHEGKLHRVDGPAIIFHDYEAWYKEGQLHRLDGPATIKKDGSYSWYKEGLLHCEIGPAIKNEEGQFFWFLEGKELTQEQFHLYLLNKDLQKKLPFSQKQKKRKV